MTTDRNSTALLSSKWIKCNLGGEADNLSKSQDKKALWAGGDVDETQFIQKLQVGFFYTTIRFVSKKQQRVSIAAFRL